MGRLRLRPGANSLARRLKSGHHTRLIVCLGRALRRTTCRMGAGIQVDGLTVVSVIVAGLPHDGMGILAWRGRWV